MDGIMIKTRFAMKRLQDKIKTVKVQVHLNKINVKSGIK